MQHAQCKCIAWIRANKLEVNKTTEVSEYWNIRNEPKAISNPDIIISMHYVMILFGIEKILLTRRSMWIFSLPVRFFLNSIFDGSDSIWKKYTSMTLSGYRLNWWKRYFSLDKQIILHTKNNLFYRVELLWMNTCDTLDTLAVNKHHESWRCWFLSHSGNTIRLTVNLLPLNDIISCLRTRLY